MDNDGVPDGCDDLVDADGDAVADADDRCQGHDDRIDVDNDGTPDGCDGLIDSDGDGVADTEDVCSGDDRLDADDDGIPDDCEPLLLNENNTANESKSTNQPPTKSTDGLDNTTETGAAGEADALRWTDGALVAVFALLGVSVLFVARRNR